MKKIFTLLFFVGQLAAYAQFSVMPNPVIKGAVPSSSVIEAKAVFKNTSTANDTEFTWNRIQNLPSGWITQVCDANTCWPDTKASSTFYMAVGDSNIIDLNITTNNNPGSTLVKLYIHPVGKPTQGDTVFYYINAFAAGTPKVTVKRDLSLYPNPAQNVLNIRYESAGELKVEIFNIIGNKVKTATHLDNSSIAIDDLPNGMYIVKVYDNGKVITRTFTKN